MKTLHVIPIGTGPLRIVLKEDRGVYLGRLDERGGTSDLELVNPALRVGSSATICDALADSFREMANFMRTIERLRGEPMT